MASVRVARMRWNVGGLMKTTTGCSSGVRTATNACGGGKKRSVSLVSEMCKWQLLMEPVWLRFIFVVYLGHDVQDAHHPLLYHAEHRLHAVGRAGKCKEVLEVLE